MATHDDQWILFRLQRLNPRRFEELCFALLAAEGHQEVRHLGASGNDRGVDLLSTDPDGVRCVTQCKRYQRISPSDVRLEVRKVINEPPARLPALYRLAATCDVSVDTEKALLEETRRAPFPLEVATTWAATELVALLRGVHPQLREHFISPDLDAGMSPLYGVPQTRSVEFLGRGAELADLEALLQQGGSVRIAASIEGLPGIGKTELALQLVHHLARGSAYPGGIFWFNAENPDLVPIWGGPIADALGVAPGPIAERAAQALRNASRQTGATLVVLDNVESWSAERRPQPLPEGTHLRYLVTTRQRRLGGTDFKHVNAGFLDAAFARQLLGAVSGRKLAEAEGHEDLVSYLGGHALAVELAGAFLGEYPAETPASYAARLRAGGDVEQEVSELVRYKQTVSQAFKTLWDRLEDAAREAWRLASCFEPELVSPELTESVGLDRQTLGRLRRLHLLEIDREGRWWMHRLTREFGRRTGTEAELLTAQQTFVKGCATFAQRIELSDGQKPYLGNRMHLDSAVHLAPDVLDPGDAQISRFQSRIATGLRSVGDLRRARELFDQALSSELEQFGEAHPSVPIRRSNLALVLQDLGDLEGAKVLLDQALSSGLEHLGEAHPSVAIRRSNLAGVLKDLGDLEGAKVLLDQALSSGLEQLGEAHPEVAIRRSNLATVLQDLGDLEGAKGLLDQALASDLEHLGEAHPYVAISRSNLAGVLQDLGDLEGAKVLLDQALSSGLEQLGEAHPEVAIRRSNLAGVLQALGDLEGGKGLLDQALASDLEQLGEAHPSVATRRSNLAGVLQALGDLEGAKAMAHKAVAGAALQPEGSLVRTQIEAAMKHLDGVEVDPRWWKRCR